MPKKRPRDVREKEDRRASGCDDVLRVSSGPSGSSSCRLVLDAGCRMRRRLVIVGVLLCACRPSSSMKAPWKTLAAADSREEKRGLLANACARKKR